MSLTSVPDILGMLILMIVLGTLRARQSDRRVDIWLLGLFFILLESVAVGVYRGSGWFHLVMHAVALDAYLVAGVTFGWAARRDLLPGSSHLPFFLLPAIPLLAINTIYGLDVHAPGPYVWIAAASLLGGLLYLPVLKIGLRLRLGLLFCHLAIWVPTLLWAAQGSLRWVVYWGLTCLYLLVAFSFRGRLRRGSVGGVVIIAGFTIWAGCFLVHPLVRGAPVVDTLVGQVWTLQKFFVILGMLLTLLEDETELRRAEAMHDALTGLPNRRLFADRLSQAVERCLRSGKSVALFVVDLNGFKTINDTYGHQAGDDILRRAGVELQARVRSSDTLARCGGDEFCIIVNDLNRRDDCDRIAASLCSALNTVRVANEAKPLSCSVGFALFPDDAADAEALYVMADRHMYEHKRGEVLFPAHERVPEQVSLFRERRSRPA